MLALPGRAHSTLINRVHHVDLFTLCDWIAEAGIQVDMILADLPYGTTACAWDTVIPFEPMWVRFKRIIKPRGAIVLTASQPFTSALVMSNPGMFRYEWVWNRSIVSGFLDANRKPLKIHESVLVFCDVAAPYYPQMGKGKSYSQTRELVPASVYGKHTKPPTINEGWRYPTSILNIPMTQTRDHPTQKPVALFRYLIRTYTRPGDIVVDPVCGSGTTAIAAREEQRRFIVGDSAWQYAGERGVARERVSAPYTLPLFGAEVA